MSYGTIRARIAGGSSAIKLVNATELNSSFLEIVRFCCYLDSGARALTCELIKDMSIILMPRDLLLLLLLLFQNIYYD